MNLRIDDAPPAPPALSVEALCVSYRTGAFRPARRVVHELSLSVAPGEVVGFLGPNGAGKSTTMRMILGLDRPTAGRATVNGRVLADRPAPLTQIGSLLEARAIHP